MIRLAAFFTALALAGCSSSSAAPTRPPGVLVLAISSDLQIPGDLDVLEVEVTSAGSTPFYMSYAIPGDASLPSTLTLVTEGSGPNPQKGTLSPGVVPIGGDGTYSITLRARHGATLVVTRTAKLDLVGSFTKRLSLPLEKACLGAPTCGDGQTCVAGACTSNQVSLASLPAP